MQIRYAPAPHLTDKQVRELNAQKELHRLMNDQFLLNARLHATPRFGPAVDGVLWRRIRPGEDDGEPETPILSVLEFTLKPGVDISHNDSAPPQRIWEVGLSYVVSVPGYCAIKWGPRIENNNTNPSGSTSIFCLVHWDSVAAWRKFQYSLSFSPIIGLIESDPSNRCAKLSPSGAPRSGSNGDTVLDVVSVVMAAEDASSPERRTAFEELWKTLVDSATNKHAGLQHSYAVWLENNASTFFNPGPTPAEAAAAITQATFTGFVAWDRARYDSRPVGEICDRLQTSLSASQAKEPAIVSRNAVQLINKTPPPEAHHGETPQPGAQHNNLASIVNAGFPRQCSRGLANLSNQAAEFRSRGIIDEERNGLRLPAPTYAINIPTHDQGQLYKGAEHRVIHHFNDRYRERFDPRDNCHLVDVVWMQLKARAPKSQGSRIHTQLKDQLSALQGFVTVQWARDVEHKRKIAVLTVWGDADSWRAASQAYQQVLDDFAASSIHLTGPLRRGQTFLMTRETARSMSESGGYSWSRSCLELIWFHVAPGAIKRELFEYAWYGFSQIAEPLAVAGPPRSCTVSKYIGGWQPDAGDTGEESASRHQVYTGALRWENPGVRQEWYKELSRLASWSYELFGHRIDALGILASGGIEARCIELQTEYGSRRGGRGG